MFTVDELVLHYYPQLNARRLLGPAVRGLLRRILREQRFAAFTRQYPALLGMDFVEQVLESFQFSYALTERERENIPVSGRLVIVANHPIGTLDGLALLKLVHDVRPDVRIVANDVLASVRALEPCLLPVRMLGGGKSVKEQIGRIEAALRREEAVIFFPAGVVSRMGARGIRDGAWQKGFLRLAAKTRSPILPVHIRARNSLPFYLTSVLARPLSTLMLAGEMFHRRKKPVQMTIGGLIPFSSYDGLAIREKDKLALFRRHLYRVGARKSPVFRTETAIARPERRVLLHKAIRQGELLGRTPDGMEMYLFADGTNEVLFREIARLRELTFRLVGEGSGKRRDRDQFDPYYQHLVLWSPDDLEIVGSYRFADSARVIADKGLEGLYSHSLFALEDACPFLQHGLELGRSFVQQRYWGKRSLDYLWFGIGAFLQRNPQYRYLFGPVSISNAMPRTAKELLIIFYRLYFSRPETPACSRNPYSLSLSAQELASSFSGQDYRADFTMLKSVLAAMGVSVPTLYKQYTELCEPGGVYFLDFNVDPAFAGCIDGLVVVDIAQLKDHKRRRYIDENAAALGLLPNTAAGNTA